MYRSLEEICEAAEGSSPYEAVLADDCKERGIKDVESKAQMCAMYEAMKQAEIGSASAMAAGAVTWLRGGDAVQIIHAAALALKSLLGLACDPVAGLVEVPCIKRNVIGAVNALTASDLAMAGILSRIPPDEVIDAMRNIGRSMPSCLKETGEGGLAVTPTGMQIKEKMPNFM